jgi:hypothetical protein
MKPGGADAPWSGCSTSPSFGDLHPHAAGALATTRSMRLMPLGDGIAHETETKTNRRLAHLAGGSE